MVLPFRGAPEGARLAEAHAVARAAAAHEDAAARVGEREATAADLSPAERPVQRAREGVAAHPEPPVAGRHLDDPATLPRGELEIAGAQADGRDHAGAGGRPAHGARQDRGVDGGAPGFDRAARIGHRRRAGARSAEHLARIGGVAAAGGVEGRLGDGPRGQPEHLARGGPGRRARRGEVARGDPVTPQHLAVGEIAERAALVPVPRGERVGAHHHRLGGERLGGGAGQRLRGDHRGDVLLEVQRPTHAEHARARRDLEGGPVPASRRAGGGDAPGAVREPVRLGHLAPVRDEAVPARRERDPASRAGEGEPAGRVAGEQLHEDARRGRGGGEGGGERERRERHVPSPSTT